jgi:hypothetical protein
VVDRKLTTVPICTQCWKRMKGEQMPVRVVWVPNADP